jgi:uncharacterized protein YlzI (FlbEa/FlbD family)
MLCKKQLGDDLIPLFAIKKAYQKEPYYPSFFIANKISEIDSIRSGHIKRIYAVSKNSTSGYIAPIFKLWEAGIIETPNEAGVLKKGWEIKFVGSHKEVEQRIVEDNNAIGATGQYSGQEDFKKMVVKVLLRYYYLPQDTLSISSNLKPYQAYIENWFLSVFSKDSKYIDVFFNSSNRITGVQHFSDEFNNALKELEMMTQYVHDFKNIESDKPKNEINTLMISGELKKLLAKNKVTEVIEKLIEHFSTIGNQDVLNEVITHSSNYYAIQKQHNLSLIPLEEYSVRKTKINLALLQLVDSELQNI